MHSLQLDIWAASSMANSCHVGVELLQRWMHTLQQPGSQPMQSHQPLHLWPSLETLQGLTSLAGSSIPALDNPSEALGSPNSAFVLQKQPIARQIFFQPSSHWVLQMPLGLGMTVTPFYRWGRQSLEIRRRQHHQSVWFQGSDPHRWACKEAGGGFWLRVYRLGISILPSLFYPGNIEGSTCMLPRNTHTHTPWPRVHAGLLQNKLSALLSRKLPLPSPLIAAIFFLGGFFFLSFFLYFSL